MPADLASQPQAGRALHPAIVVLRALDAIFPALLAAIDRIAGRIPAFAIPLNHRLVRAHRRLAAILAHLAAGTFPGPRAPRPPGRKGGPPAPYLPRRRGWLAVAVDHNARNVALQLQSLLADPATVAMLAAAPAHARTAVARVLRTPCRLLGIDLPAVLQPAAPPPARPRRTAPRPPQPKPQAPAPLAPLNVQDYVRAAARAWKPRFG